MKLPDIDYFLAGFTSEGVRVFPLSPRGKNPATAHGVKDATLAPDLFASKWEEGCNLAIATGGPLDVVDCDSLGCFCGFARRLSGAETELSPAAAAETVERMLGPVVWTSRGAHVYCAAIPGRKNGAHLIQLDDGWVDYRAAGGYCVAPPSIHPSGAVYRFNSAYFPPKAPAPDWIWETQQEKAAAPVWEAQQLPRGETPERYFEKALEGALEDLSAAPTGARNQMLNHYAFKVGQLVSNQGQAEKAFEGLYSTARALGLGKTEIRKTIESGLNAGAAKPRRPLEAPDASATVKIGSTFSAAAGDVSISETAGAEIEAKITTKKKPTLPDIAQAIRDSFPGLLGFDLFSQRITKLKDQPNEPESRHGLDRWEDIDQTVLAQNLSEILGRDIPTETLSQAVQLAAHQNETQPVREYLQRCRAAWDGASRIKGFLRAIGAAETKAHRLELAFWLAGAAARGMKDESVKFDSMLILEGPQGTGKSTIVKILGGAWAMDTPIDLDQPREAYMQLAGNWICEWPELTSFVKTAPEKLKAFLSKEYDDFRAPWGRNVSRLIRHCAFIGTTNDDQYLRDDTGNRRFWPIRCGRKIFDFGWLKANRDQLWGEAVELCAAYTRRGLGFAAAPGVEAEILAAQVQTRQQIDEIADQAVATVQDLFDRAWDKSSGIFVTLEQIQKIPAFSNLKKSTIKRVLESIGGTYTRKFSGDSVDFSSGEGQARPAPKERVRGCQFDSRPTFAADYNDADFGEIFIPTE